VTVTYWVSGTRNGWIDPFSPEPGPSDFAVQEANQLLEFQQAFDFFAFFDLRAELASNASTVIIDGIAKATCDGKGNFTQLDAVADNGNLDAPGFRLARAPTR
jgi:hypothetical protein